MAFEVSSETRARQGTILAASIARFLGAFLRFESMDGGRFERSRVSHVTGPTD